jgi:hypothetical protein
MNTATAANENIERDLGQKKVDQEKVSNDTEDMPPIAKRIKTMALSEESAFREQVLESLKSTDPAIEPTKDAITPNRCTCSKPCPKWDCAWCNGNGWVHYDSCFVDCSECGGIGKQFWCELRQIDIP